jgi:hypothetical protein
MLETESFTEFFAQAFNVRAFVFFQTAIFALKFGQDTYFHPPPKIKLAAARAFPEHYDENKDNKNNPEQNNAVN